MNPYDVLNVRKNASNSEIKLSFHKLMDKYDLKNYLGDSYFAKKRLHDITEAYNLLSDPKKRAKYDKEHENHTNMHKSSSDTFTPYYNIPKTTEHIHNDAEIAKNKYNNSNPISDDPITDLYSSSISDDLSDETTSDISAVLQDSTIFSIIVICLLIMSIFGPIFIGILAFI